jgi:hypothetical protein
MIHIDTWAEINKIYNAKSSSHLGSVKPVRVME